MLQSSCTLVIRNSFPMRNFSAGPWAITPENLPTGRSLRKTDYVKLIMSCCRVIFADTSAITPPWLASVVTVMNFERGHEGAS